jgi:hypothetical protein
LTSAQPNGKALQKLPGNCAHIRPHRQYTQTLPLLTHTRDPATSTPLRPGPPAQGIPLPGCSSPHPGPALRHPSRHYTACQPLQLACMREIQEIRAACCNTATPSRRSATQMPDPRPPRPYYRCAVAVTYKFALYPKPYDPKWDRIAQPATDWHARPLIVKQGTVLDYAATQQHLLDYLALALQPVYTRRMCVPNVMWR